MLAACLVDITFMRNEKQLAVNMSMLSQTSLHGILYTCNNGLNFGTENVHSFYMSNASFIHI